MWKQIEGGFCGPAVLQHLIHSHGFYISQEEIVSVIGGREKVMRDGTTPRQLSCALNKLVPDLVLWSKSQATWQDAVAMVERYGNNPLGNGIALDIQCVYIDLDILVPGAIQNRKVVLAKDKTKLVRRRKATILKEALKEDNGHYIVVTDIYKNGYVKFLDPSYKYPRFLPTSVIINRWWDVNDGKVDERILMLVTRRDDRYPEQFGLVNLAVRGC